MSAGTHPAPSFGRIAAVLGGVVLIVGAWILATPPNGGPDEISHRLRGEALIQGSPGAEVIEAPIRLVWPDISCFALYSERPASCITTDPAPEGTGEFDTRASDYPIWGHVITAAAVRAGSISSTPYLERAVAAIVPIALVAAAVVLALRRRALAAALSVVALTPMAWFTLAVVNPSDLVIAGALLAWVAVGLAAPPGGVRSSAADWMFAVGIVAVMLPRRDSAFWAATILIAAALLQRRAVVRSVRSLGRWPAVVVTAAAALTVVWALTSNRQTVGLVGLSAALVVLHDAWRWGRSRAPRAARPAVDVGAGVGVALLAVAAVASRSRGLADREVIGSVLAETLPNLREAVGAVGTLDARVPWWAATVLAATVLALWVASRRVAEPGVDRRALVLAPVVLGTAIASAWVLELARDDTTGTYWQGRYYLPLLIGVVVLAGLPLVNRLDAERSRPWSGALVAVAAVVATATYVVALRRWGVGTSGPWDPLTWDTYGAPGSPPVLAAMHTAGLGLLGGAVLLRRPG